MKERIDDEMLAVFLAESRENLELIEAEILRLESAPGDAEAVKRMYRAFHTIKGSCGFAGFTKLGELAHAGEDILGPLRGGAVASREAVGSLLVLIDGTRRLLDRIASSGGEEDSDVAPPVGSAKGTAADGKSPEEGTWAIAPAPGPAPEAAASSDRRIRVDQERLDRLEYLSGEIGLLRDRVAASLPEGERSAPNTPLRRLGVAIGEVRGEVAQMRLVRVEELWRGMPRLARDVAQACGKEVILDMSRSEVRLDRVIVEALRESMVHLVRNAIDHGVEVAEKRVACGKPREGRMELRAAESPGVVRLEVADDGAGIDPAKLRRKAESLGVLAGAAAATLSDREALDLIFRPAFSTAETVTKISGRGVGMDAVRTSVEAMGGRIDVASEVGRGTTFRLTVPMSLSVMRLLIVRAGGGRYAIPAAVVERSIRLRAAEESGDIALIGGVRKLRDHGRVLPLVDLAHVLGVAGESAGGAGDVQGSRDIVVFTDGRSVFGLIVDGVVDVVDIPVRPLSRYAGLMRAFSGAALADDGDVIPVLDGARFTPPDAEVGEAEEAGRATWRRTAGAGKALRFLVEADEEWAVSLECVRRIERVEAVDMDRSGGLAIARGRHGNFPVVFATGSPDSGAAAFDVIVCNHAERQVGIAVRRILDIAEHAGKVTDVGSILRAVGVDPASLPSGSAAS